MIFLFLKLPSLTPPCLRWSGLRLKAYPTQVSADGRISSPHTRNRLWNFSFSLPGMGSGLAGRRPAWPWYSYYPIQPVQAQADHPDHSPGTNPFPLTLFKRQLHSLHALCPLPFLPFAHLFQVLPTYHTMENICTSHVFFYTLFIFNFSFSWLLVEVEVYFLLCTLLCILFGGLGVATHYFCLFWHACVISWGVVGG